MTLLSLDSSGLVASVALLVDDVIRAEYSVNYKKTHSQTLLPMLDEIIKMTETDKKEIDAIAVASGPGSFTGLRIGSATAKGLGLALKKPLIAVPTLEGLAYNLYGSDKIICPMMDARRMQVYTGTYEFVDGQFSIVHKQDAISIEECIKRINELGRETVFLGDGVKQYAEVIKELSTVKYSFAPPHRNQQSAAAVALRGKEMLLENENAYVSAEIFAPEYLRLSQAERERGEKLKKEAQTNE